MKCSIEIYFLRFAFPCSHISVERGRLSVREYERLRNIAIAGRLPSGVSRKDFRRKMERIFEPAFRRIRAMMVERGFSGTVWKRDVFEEYFLKEHNRIISAGIEDYGSAPEVLKELCKVKKGHVVLDEVLKSPEGNNFTKVKFEDGSSRVVIVDFLGEDGLKLAKGDEVLVHHGYLVSRAN